MCHVFLCVLWPDTIEIMSEHIAKSLTKVYLHLPEFFVTITTYTLVIVFGEQWTLINARVIRHRNNYSAIIHVTNEPEL